MLKQVSAPVQFPAANEVESTPSSPHNQGCVSPSTEACLFPSPKQNRAENLTVQCHVSTLHPQLSHPCPGEPREQSRMADTSSVAIRTCECVWPALHQLLPRTMEQMGARTGRGAKQAIQSNPPWSGFLSLYTLVTPVAGLPLSPACWQRGWSLFIWWDTTCFVIWPFKKKKIKTFKQTNSLALHSLASSARLWQLHKAEVKWQYLGDRGCGGSQLWLSMEVDIFPLKSIWSSNDWVSDSFCKLRVCW